MSNPLFASHIMQMAYLCKTPVYPEELLCLYPFNGTAQNFSRYETTIASVPTFYNEGPLGKCATFNGAITHPQTTNFTIEYYVSFPSDNSKRMYFSSGSYEYGGKHFGQSYYQDSANIVFQAFGSYNDSISVSGGGTAWTHIAITYNGSIVILYVNGLQYLTRTVSMYPQNSITLNSGVKICNLRILSKVLGNGTTFPVPTAFYTGYEAL